MIGYTFNSSRKHLSSFYLNEIINRPKKCLHRHHRHHLLLNNIRTNFKGSKVNNGPKGGNDNSIEHTDNFLSLLASRIVTAFGLLHLLSEYGFEMTKCEGPSMLPTIKSSGDIILVEKFSHRIHGISGGDDGERRASNARAKQLEWESKESKLWLADKHRFSSSEQQKDSLLSSSSNMRKAKNTNDYDVMSREELTSIHTWHEPMVKPVNYTNRKDFKTWLKSFAKFKRGIEVGDVVVVQNPNRDGTVCKRVLGLPGDVILRPKRTNNGALVHSRNRGKHQEMINLFFNYNKGMRKNDASYLSLSSLINDSSLLVVPNGHIWIEGDNSMNSSDSRNYGPVPACMVVGKVWMRIWPLRGNAIMISGSCPIPPQGAPFTGSTRLPAGYEGETIVVDDS
mmetsp:Transcript_9027/g.11366  ORF Transcript_9027/g.11366 Transcript_9027/m.11366 type:complete len:396 (-) Transcript_9027:109-1296(-)